MFFTHFIKHHQATSMGGRARGYRGRAGMTEVALGEDGEGEEGAGAPTSCSVAHARGGCYGGTGWMTGMTGAMKTAAAARVHGGYGEDDTGGVTMRNAKSREGHRKT